MIQFALAMVVGLSSLVTDHGDAPSDDQIIAKLPKGVDTSFERVIVKNYLSTKCLQAKDDTGPVWTIVFQWECIVYIDELIETQNGIARKVKHYIVYMEMPVRIGKKMLFQQPSETRY